MMFVCTNLWERCPLTEPSEELVCCVVVSKVKLLIRKVLFVKELCEFITETTSLLGVNVEFGTHTCEW